MEIATITGIQYCPHCGKVLAKTFSKDCYWCSTPDCPEQDILKSSYEIHREYYIKEVGTWYPY